MKLDDPGGSASSSVYPSESQMKMLPSYGANPVKKVFAAMLERAGLLSGSAGGVAAHCDTPEQIEAIARKLAGPGSLGVRQITALLHRLSALPGQKLYLHVTRRVLPYSIVLEPGDNPLLWFAFGRGLTAASTPLPEDLPTLTVLWVHSGGNESEFRAHCPESLGYATVVAGGRVLLDTQRVQWSDGLISLRVEAA